MVPSSPTVCYGALDPRVGGTFHFEILVMPPLTKTCSKMVLPIKGGSLCVKNAFAKKFFGVGRDSAVGALASVLRKTKTCAHKSAFSKRGSVNVRFAPKATEVQRCREWTGCFSQHSASALMPARCVMLPLCEVVHTQRRPASLPIKKNNHP